MDQANDAVFFLTFMPGVSGKNNIIGEAADLAANTDKLILGAISDPAAMPPPTAGRARPPMSTPKASPANCRHPRSGGLAGTTAA